VASYKYPCIVYRQRVEVGNAPTFCLFHAPVGQLLEWAAIVRLEDDTGTSQPSPAKVMAIKRFLTNEPKNTIPTSIILTIDQPGYDLKPLNPDVQENHYLGILALTDGEKKPGLVIDGQHRLLGMQHFNPQLSVNVVALLNADDTEKAFQFMVINNKASQVSKENLEALALHYEKQQLDKRLKTARLTLTPNLGFVGLIDTEDGSPFKGIIRWDTTNDPLRIVPPAAIEASMSYIQQQRVKPLESDDVLLEFFYSIWKTVKDRWASLWHKDSKLLKKVGILCLTQYITNALIASYDWERLDISDPSQVIKHVAVLLRHQEKNFWVLPWIPSNYDTPSGRALIVESLVQISRNLRGGDLWYADVKVVDVTQLEIMAQESM